jgi:hypothetical protein
MWGRSAWFKTGAGQGNCWGGDPSSWFAAVERGDACDQNWSLGVGGWLGDAQSRPRFASGSAPALLGFDGSIWDFCQQHSSQSLRHGSNQERAYHSALHPQRRSDASLFASCWTAGLYPWSPSWGVEGDFTDSIAWRCMEAGQNILRQKAAWNMCVNVSSTCSARPHSTCRTHACTSCASSLARPLVDCSQLRTSQDDPRCPRSCVCSARVLVAQLVWLSCATRGRLPGQRGRELHFASAPRDLDWAGYEDAGRTGSWWMEPHWQTFAVSDVFFAEVAMLNLLCANSQDLFGVGVGDTFTCDVDPEGLPELRRLLVGF